MNQINRDTEKEIEDRLFKCLQARLVVIGAVALFAIFSALKLSSIFDGKDGVSPDVKEIVAEILKDGQLTDLLIKEFRKSELTTAIHDMGFIPLNRIDIFGAEYISKGQKRKSCNDVCVDNGKNAHCLMAFGFSSKGEKLDCGTKPTNVLCVCAGVNSVRDK